MIDDLELDEDFLAHAYDAQKAHEYYMRTRKLKGRQPGKGRPSTGARPRGSSSGPVKSNRPATKAATEARVAALEARLAKLKAHLAKLVSDAKKRSGVEPTKKDDSKDKKAGSRKSGGKSDLTKAEKAEKAKKAREEYEKEKDKTPEPSNKEQIADLQKQIREIESKIREAIAEARRKSNSKTASKGR